MSLWGDFDKITMRKLDFWNSGPPLWPPKKASWPRNYRNRKVTKWVGIRRMIHWVTENAELSYFCLDFSYCWNGLWIAARKGVKLPSNDVPHAKFIGAIVLVVYFFAFLWGCLSGSTSFVDMKKTSSMNVWSAGTGCCCCCCCCCCFRCSEDAGFSGDHFWFEVFQQISDIQICFWLQGPFFTVVPCWKCFPQWPVNQLRFLKKWTLQKVQWRP